MTTKHPADKVAPSAIWDIDGACGRGDAAFVHLADLLVAVAIFGVVSAGMFTVLQEGLRVYMVGAARAESQQSARVAVERLAAEIRTAGLGPRSAAFAAIAVAEPSHIVLHHDLDGNGVIAGSGETTTWRLVGTTLRRDAGGGAQPIIDGVRQFTLEYRDASDNTVAVADDVRTVVITLVTEAAWDLADRAVATRFATRVRLRNR
jgi:type II secretory pathway component PulJ